jgi:glycerophosphoryl diester phosphodiesterase
MGLLDAPPARSRKLITVDNAFAGGYKVFHRGTGANNTWVAPEHTMEGYRVALAMGCNVLDIDIQTTVDGVLVCHHDTDLLRSAGIASNVSDYLFAHLPQVDWRHVVGPGWGTQNIPTFEEVLVSFAGRVILDIEPKDISFVAPLVALIKKYGMERSVMLNSSDPTIVAACSAAGMFTEYWGIAGNSNVDTAVAAGANVLQINYANMSTSLVNYANSKKGSQVKFVICSPVQRRYERDLALGFGSTPVDAVVNDAPGYLNGAVLQASSLAKVLLAQKVGTGWMSSFDPFQVKQSIGGIIDATGVMLSRVGVGYPGTPRALRIGEFCGPKAASYSLEFWWKTSSADGTNIRPTFRACTLDDRGTGIDSDVANGYEFDMRVSGQMRLYRNTAGTYTQLGTVQTQTPAQADGAVAKLKLYVTPTTITLVRTDIAAAVLSAAVSAGTITSLPVNAVPAAIASGTVLRLSNGQYATTSSAVSASATSIPINSLALTPGLASGASMYFCLGPISDATYRGNYVWISGATPGNANGATMWLTDLRYTANDV